MLEKLILYFNLYRIRALYTVIGGVAVMLMIYSATTLLLFFPVSDSPTHAVTTRKIALPLYVVPQNTVPATTKTVTTQQDAPPINLTLTGIIFSKNAAQSRAILLGPEGQKGYASGSALEKHPDVIVVQIRPEAVVLNNRGKEQTLVMPLHRSPGSNRANPPAPTDRYRLGHH